MKAKAVARIGTLSAATLLLAVGCADVDRNPSREGDPTFPGGTEDGVVDAGAPADAAIVRTITGKLCSLLDVRAPLSCEPADLTGVTVTVRGTDSTAVALQDGTFTVDAPSDPDAVLVAGVDDPTWRNSVVPVTLPNGSVTDIAVLIVEQLAWDDLLITLSASEPDDSASVVLFVERDGVPLPGAQVTPPEGTPNEAYYDTANGVPFTQGGTTGVNATVLLVGVPVAMDVTSIQVIDEQSTSTLFDIPIEPNATTFAVVDLGN